MLNKYVHTIYNRYILTSVSTSGFHSFRGSKEGKSGYGECEIVLILEQNIVARFVCINEYAHRLTFGIFYYVKYYDRIEIQCGAFFHTLIKYIYTVFEQS